MAEQHLYQDLIHLFNQLFEHTEQTILLAGGNEPLYLPKDEHSQLNRIIFTKDYYASALHEIAHWCIAGQERRQLIDYGYWYQPDRNSADAQDVFEQAEAKPQALEWIFSQAAGFKFLISADNLARNNEASEHFKQMIYQHARQFLEKKLPKRAALFTECLLDFYQHRQVFDISAFSVAQL